MGLGFEDRRALDTAGRIEKEAVREQEFDRLFRGDSTVYIASPRKISVGIDDLRLICESLRRMAKRLEDMDEKPNNNHYRKRVRVLHRQMRRLKDELTTLEDTLENIERN